MDKKIAVEINGRIHNLSDRAISLLNLKKHIVLKDKPIELLKMPPRFDDIKKVEIKKAEIKPEAQTEVKPEDKPIVANRRRRKDAAQ
jgi:hypothetical protein